MKLNVIIKRSLILLLSTGMLIQAPLATAAQPAKSPAPPVIRDVRLNDDGMLHGVVIDGRGSPVAGAVVKISQQGREVATAMTGKHGSFDLAGMRGGVFEISQGQVRGFCRVWTAEAAPPHARRGLLLVDSLPLVRGQNDNLGRAAAIRTLGAIALALGLGYAIYEIADDDAS